jgi:mono/diheme cytochrome c family protein
MRSPVPAQFFAILSLLLATASAEPPRTVEFNRDVRPILSDHCFQCHGPDAKQRQADLRLDMDEKLVQREGGAIVTGGNLARSELWRRVTSTDANEQMPPPDKGRRLTDAEIATLRQWILEGAQFERHWSLLPIRRPGQPSVEKLDAATNPLDTFVMARLEREGLSPAPKANRATLLRRVTLGLTGLPPTPDEIDSHLDDLKPDAYERVVDRLLASPRYGERMAVPWLDAARYADTSGYQSDGERHMWRWRDWVIEALNANLPFDQFTIEQLAGDLLPNPTLEQRIATGFNRNHRGNAEGGIIPEEYAVEYVADRVETTATVWLGLTLGCARCHDHKYDPLSQRDFYSLFAFFNNVAEKGRAIKIGNSPPYIQAPTRLEREELQRLELKQVRMAENMLAGDRQWTATQLEWERHAAANESEDWYPHENLIAHLPFDDEFRECISGGLAECSDYRVEFGVGRLNRAARFDGKSSLAIEKLGAFGFFDKFTLAAWVFVEDADRGGTIVSRMIDAPEGEGYQLALVGGKLQFNLVKRWLDDALRVETVESVPIGGWHHVTAVYDGSREAEGVKLYVDGKPQQLKILLDELNQTFATKEPLRIGGGGGPQTRFRGAIDDVRIYARALSPSDALILATPRSIAEILSLNIDKRTEGESLKLKGYYLEHHAPAEMKRAFRELEEANRTLTKFLEKLPTVMVMEEMPTPRPTHLLVRGQYDKAGEQVDPDVPAYLPRMVDRAPRNRLGLANWLVDRSNPLTSRVIVNRAWQLHFGTGIVKTAEDFGRQGEWPSHLALLDWLAAEFMDDWDVKRLHRTIVTSETYRQSSENLESKIQNPKSADPDNRLLSRGPRLRLSAEMVRDQALFVSGLLVEQVGGPSVKPLQPEGLWSELTGGEDYKPGNGSDLVRRSLYTFWKRTIPPPTLATFDSSSREACVVRESRTNTPLQALALMNEPTFVMAANALGERVMREATTPEERIERAMLHVVGRRPTTDELAILKSALKRYEGRADAYVLLCSTIFNLDETITLQ